MEIEFTWKHIVITLIASMIATLLAIYAVILSPIAPFPGVSGLYLAAAVYVPLSLWLGIWGCIVGYVSQLLLGFITTPFGLWNFIWAFADFLEGLVPLLAFRLLKEDVDIAVDLERPFLAKILIVALLGNLTLAAIATFLVIEFVWLITFFVAIGLSIAFCVTNPSRSRWIFLLFGIIAASFASAIIGVWIPIIANPDPLLTQDFWIGVLGWFAGDIIVLSAISTFLMFAFTNKIKETSVFVENWLS
ncbi:MAG: hypothetical protein ACTSR3_12780 [Candidatus Helarchaeota archaeon]